MSGNQSRVHTARKRAILSAFAGALLASTPRSDALLAVPAALPRSAASARGQDARQRGARSAPATAFGMQRRPSSSSCAPAAGGAGGSRSSIVRSSRRGRTSLLVMSGFGGEEAQGGAEGDATLGSTEGEAVEGQGVMSRSPGAAAAAAASSAAEGKGEKLEDGVISASSSAGEAAAVGSSAAAAGTRIKKRKKKSAKRTKKAPSRLEGEALRNELMRREKREEERVLAVNTLFYRSRAYNEIEDLKRVWDKSELSECIRSIGGPLRGYDNIIEEYKTDFLLAQKQEKPGLRPFKVKDIQVQTCGTLAWVTCIEDMRSPYKPYPKTVQLVTNVFRKTSSGWRLTRHHASDRDVPVTKSAGNKQVLKPSRELPGGGSSLLHNFVDKTGGVTELSARLFRVVNGEMRPFDLDFNPSDGGMGDDDDEDDEDEDEVEEDITDQIGREIASQIFLNYGDLFEDGKEGGEGITEIPLGEINFTSSSSSPAGKSSSGSTSSSESFDETIPPAMRKRIEEAELEARLKEKRGSANERFKNIYNVSKGLKEVTQDSSGSDTDADGARDDAEWGDIGSSGKQWASASGGGSSSETDGGAGQEDGEREVEDAIAARESRDLTRKTVDAVRVLAEMGRINARQKGLLLADVIRNASSAGSSRAEVAYSLLLDGYVTPEGMEYTEKADEFADQLKAITAQLEEQQNSDRRRWWKFWAKPQWWKFWTKPE